MSTVNANLAKLAQIIDPIAKGTSTTAAGQRFHSSSDSIAIASSSGTSPIEITTATAHGRVTGDIASIIGHTTNTAANNTAANPYWVLTYVSPTKFTLNGSVFTAAGGATGTVVPCLVGSADGTRFLRQRLLDIYNEARMVLFNALYETKSPSELGKLVSATFTSASITIAAYGAPYRTITKPAGFLTLVNMVDGAATPLRIDVLPTSLLEDVRTSVTPTYTASATNLLAFEIGSNWCIYGNYGTTPAAVDYYGISAWTWFTDVLPNTTNESFRADLEPILIEIACAIADEQSNTDVMALAKMLLNKKGQ